MARKLNKKFVIGLVGVAVLGAGALVALPYARNIANLFKDSIPELERKGDVAMAAGDYHEAAAKYGLAANRAQTNLDLQIKFVDAYDYTVAGNPERMNQLRNYYARIFQTDQNNLPVMRRLLNVQQQDVQQDPRNRERIRTLQETAQRILKQDPKDVEAKKALVLAVLEPFTRNLGVSQEEADAAREQAEQALKDHPANGDLLQYVVQFRLKDAQNAALRGDTAYVRESLDKARALVEETIKAQPEFPDAYFAAFQVHRAMRYFSPGVDNAKRAEMYKQEYDYLVKADALAKPGMEDDRFLQIRSQAIDALEQVDPRQAEDRYRQLVGEMPSHRRPRLMLAQFLAKQPARRDDAIAILRSKWQPQKPLRGLESMTQAGYEINEQLRLSVILLASLEGVDDTNERNKRLKEVEDNYARLATIQSPSLQPWLRRIEGGLALERGRISEATQKYGDALKMLAADSPNADEQDMRNEVLAEFAFAHLRLGQTGKARPPLQELVQREPANHLARAKLIELLILESRLDEAEKMLAPFRTWFKDNPAVERLWLMLQSKQRDRLAATYATMSETTRDNRLLKMQTARVLRNTDEILRLGQLMLDTDPGDIDATATVADTLIGLGRRAEAIVVVDNALKAKPGNLRLKSFRENLAAETPEQQQQVVQQQIENITDPYVRELTRAEVLRSQGKGDEAIAALIAAEKLNPKDTRALELQFATYVAMAKVPEAEATLKRLSQLDTDPVKSEEKAVQLMIARAYQQQGEARQTQLEAALTEASKVAQKYNDIASSSLLYAKLLHELRNYGEAAEWYAQTIEKSPTNIEALRGSVACLMALGRVPEARNRLEEARRVAPNDPGLRQLDLEWEINHGDPLRAIDTLTDVWQKNQDDPQAWFQLGAAFERVARSKEAKNDRAAARQFMTRAADHWDKSRAKFPREIRFAFVAANAHRALGDSVKAEEIFVKLLDTDEWRGKPEMVEALAEQYAMSGKAQQAEQTLVEFLNKTDPKPTSTLVRLSILYAQNEKMNEALAVLEAKRDDPAVRRQRIELLIIANQLDAARIAIEEALAREPSADIYLVAAYVELNSRNFEKADGFVTKVLQERPNDPAALFYRAKVRLSRTPQNVEGAREDLQKVVSMAPGNVEARLTLAEMYSAAGQREQAVRELEKAWQLNRTQKVVLLRLIDAYMSALPPQYHNAQKAMEQANQSPGLANDVDVIFTEAQLSAARTPPDIRKAMELAKKALAIAPENPNVQQRYFETLLRARQYRDLLRESEPVLAKDPGAWWLYRLRGLAQRRDGNRLEAEREFDAAFKVVVPQQNEQAIGMVARTIASELSPAEAIKRVEPIASDDLSIRVLLASLYQGANLPSQAIEQLERIMVDRQRLRPDQLRMTLQMLGNAYLQVGSPDRALKIFEELLKETPNDILLLNNLAYVHTLPGSGGSLQKALTFSSKAYQATEKATTLDEQTLYVWDTHGWVLVQTQGRRLEGIELLRRAAEQARFPEVHLHLAEAYLMSDNEDDLLRAGDALAGARRLIEEIESAKRPLDPTVKPKFEQLSGQLESRRRQAVGAG